ncbi:MAG TPA: Mur ligase family protein, partial [Vicinamibacteria bacterium]|nr:Mur ligase family protein [Vicinamibacteria bacterium]
MRGIAVALTALDIDAVAVATEGRATGASPTTLKAPLLGVSIDSRTLKPGELFVAVVGKHFDGHAFLGEAKARGASAAVVQKDVDGVIGLPVVRVADTTRALGDLARHRRREAEAPVVAITGSVGKTTTKDLTAALLASRGPVLRTEGNLNNQYGLPLTLLRLGPEHTAVVVEMGMSAPGELRTLTQIARPDVAVITNVGTAHLEFFGSADEIAKAKAEIL